MARNTRDTGAYHFTNSADVIFEILGPNLYDTAVNMSRVKLQKKHARMTDIFRLVRHHSVLFIELFLRYGCYLCTFAVCGFLSRRDAPGLCFF